jgi:hypothetical protein
MIARVIRHARPIYLSTVFGLLAVMLVAYAPPHLQGLNNVVSPVACSTVDTSAPSPTVPAAYIGGTPGEGMIVPSPGRPMRVVATANGGGTTPSIAVPDGRLLVGGAIGVEFVARNDSYDPLGVAEPRLGLQDEAGPELTLHEFVPGNWPGSYPRPDDRQILPGQSLDLIFNVQLPSASDLKGHTYHLVAQMRPMESSQSGLAVPATTLQAVSRSLALVQPGASHQLHAKLYPRNEGWCLQVLTGDGSRPTSPLTASLWAQSLRVATDVPLSGGDQDVWVGTWPKEHRGGGPIHVQIWVAGSGYVTAQLDQTVPGD